MDKGNEQKDLRIGQSSVRGTVSPRVTRSTWAEFGRFAVEGLRSSKRTNTILSVLSIQ